MSYSLSKTFLIYFLTFFQNYTFATYFNLVFLHKLFAFLQSLLYSIGSNIGIKFKNGISVNELSFQEEKKIFKVQPIMCKKSTKKLEQTYIYLFIFLSFQNIANLILKYITCDLIFQKKIFLTNS